MLAALGRVVHATRDFEGGVPSIDLAAGRNAFWQHARGSMPDARVRPGYLER